MEIFVGVTIEQKEFWEIIFSKMLVIPLTESEIDNTIKIIKNLKKTNKIIELPDILIAATAISNNLELAT